MARGLKPHGGELRDHAAVRTVRARVQAYVTVREVVGFEDESWRWGKGMGTQKGAWLGLESKAVVGLWV